METLDSSELSSGASVPYLGCYTRGGTMRVILALICLFFSIPSSAIEISNFKSGLACTNTKLSEDAKGWICQPSVDILVTDQGKCVFNGIAKPCTWIGFEFDFKNAKKQTKLQCTETLSAPAIPGNPENVLGKESTKHNYELELEGESGHFYNPQYFMFSLRSKENAQLLTKTSCAFEGAIVFEYQFNLRFPVPTN